MPCSKKRTTTSVLGGGLVERRTAPANSNRETGASAAVLNPDHAACCGYATMLNAMSRMYDSQAVVGLFVIKFKSLERRIDRLTSIFTRLRPLSHRSRFAAAVWSR